MSEVINDTLNSTEPSYRRVNLGRIVGDNSYELAVKHGKFEGTEEEYVEKEQKTYDDMVAYCEALKSELSGVIPLPQKMSLRMNDIGELEEDQIDTVMESFGTNDGYHLTSDGKFVYTCSCGTNLYIGMENTDNGVQLRLGFVTGLSTRRKKDGVWGPWVSGANISNEEVV